MTTEVRAAPRAGESWPDPPRDAAGEPFQYGMTFNAGTLLAWSTSATELVGLLVDGYLDVAEADLGEQATLRAMYAVGAQVRAQARLLITADLSMAEGDELAVLTGPRERPPEVAVWRCPIPLVLVDAFYEPYADRPRPASEPRDGSDPGSNIIWLSHSDESAFLTSLVGIDEIALATPDYSVAPTG